MVFFKVRIPLLTVLLTQFSKIISYQGYLTTRNDENEFRAKNHEAYFMLCIVLPSAFLGLLSLLHFLLHKITSFYILRISFSGSLLGDRNGFLMQNATV